MPVHIRTYADRDFDAVRTLEGTARAEPYTQAVFIRQAACLFPSTFLVAEEDGAVVGYTIGAQVQDESGEAWILRLNVAAQSRRRGIGARLLTTLTDRLAAEGARSCRLSVSPENRPALPLYARHGFAVTGEHGCYFGEGEARLIMKKTLAQPGR